ncbi:MAG TPA: 23S rRNA (adenine(2030)-N(6))-methyltransferase RlmJ [Methanothrix sp.]|uniref:23S rRNA (adenine(2030)-N(6))-methyltransferase RlmJ n=1 Tax=Methanothrix sp. TaxID=90426 RepID=UPI001B6A5CE8|nr:23S rRNA (adenine(2030)-N(6))-methyltransferase RlmJ [Methanothrix sp.]MBP8625029.1 23S rRNA (adenine(2030)-N(6))-methyltransferase RlmJ [Methanothrix sp.]HPC90578.1 23S rRNA (adenine(2030)-N(6))-methyltransferase RlmJ [Methanothrix sp.]HQE88452.1 23S rRNA (adenine(2030)-N(6))-methyltransferase RlmJ [Methanothrix sp.]HQI69023.1 23S rRNA (adenine(2030)-N(6))-methyltransferase RlmJ [Methanothrix sp.]HRS85949.1 23S rRNA (adenine(2030)-N(6))-methyltransferase RlmJ [Methanothrix sp.]
MVSYDHRRHAGNAGDVWKHFIVCEAAGFLIELGTGADAACGGLNYAESHAGRPDYILRAPGEWQGGIGRVLPHLLEESSLRELSYFDILADLNSSKEGLVYPGSGRLAIELAKRMNARLWADLWDCDRDVVASWDCFLRGPKSGGLAGKVVIHMGEGFSGVLSRLKSSAAGLLFIDPPYVDSRDTVKAERLLKTARKLGWTVLWWYMTDLKTIPTLSGPGGLAELELQFDEAGLEGGGWEGSTVALAGSAGEAEGDEFERLLAHLERRRDMLIRILKSV